jgi:hypothetical protein
MRLIPFTTPAVVLLAFSTCDAKSRWIQVTPKSAKSHHLHFETKSAKIDGKAIEKFQITIRRPKGDLSPFVDAHLSIYDGKQLIASCPIAFHRRKNVVTLEFQVSQRFLEQSKFSFAEFGHVGGKAMPSADFFWFYLGDFQKRVARKPK